MTFPPTSESQTQRIVLLIDLHPLLCDQRSNEYVSILISAAETILSQPSLSSCLFSFKLFFSTLSPLLSSSKIHLLLGRYSIVSFNLPSQALASLSDVLNSLPYLASSSDAGPPCETCARASLVAGSIRQILHEYPWQTAICDSRTALPHLLATRSNLIIIFSVIHHHLIGLSRFLEAKSVETKALYDKFIHIFSPVNQELISRDIHLGWVDVNIDMKWTGRGEEDFELGFKLFRQWIQSLGWGLCSTDAIVVGSTLIHFDLIFPNISHSIDILSNGYRAEFSLSILDINKKPLECKYDVEVFMSPGTRCRSFWSKVPADIHINEARRITDQMKIKEGCFTYSTLLRCLACEADKDRGRIKLDDFFANKVLEILCRQENEFMAEKPAWQLLLYFLHKEQCLASVTICNAEGSCITGILKPLTIHYAVLYIVDQKVAFSEIFVPNKIMGSADALSDVRSVTNTAGLAKGNRRWNIMRSNLGGDLSWSTYRQMVISPAIQGTNTYPGLELDLEMLYLYREGSAPKKLRFLKCWMKQIRKSFGSQQTTSDEDMTQVDVKEVRESETCLNEQQHNEMLPPPHLPLNQTNNRMIESETDSVVSYEKTPELFFQGVPLKVQESLDSSGVELGLFAERLVATSLYCLYEHYKRGCLAETPAIHERFDAVIVDELEKHLLKHPRDLDKKYRDFCRWEPKVREHELQILLRMEILQSGNVNIEETERLKMVKEICLLLENIEFNLQGGMFGGESLIEFAGRTIKSRYKRSLGDIVHRIYTNMGFLASDEEGEEASISLNDDDADEEEKLRYQGDEGAGGSRNVGIRDGGSMSSECKSGVEWMQERKIVEARERRERSRRYASFTSWIPDLQRVWAPRQTGKASARGKGVKGRREGGTRVNVVRETPMREAHLMTRSPKRERGSPCGGVRSKRSLFRGE